MAGKLGEQAMRIADIVAVTALLCGSAALADNAGLPPNRSAGLPDDKPQLAKHSMFDAVVLGKFRVVFEKTTLAEVAAKAGGGRIKHRGDAGESEYWLCYRFNEGRATREVSVTASGEMGGPDHAVGSVVVKDKASGETDCPYLPAKLLPVKTDLGLGLGARLEDFLRPLGKPVWYDRNSAMWMLERQTHLAGSPEAWSVSQSIKVEFHDGKAATLSLDQVTSN
ncbi:MAG: hypothetical protein P4L57_00890 [Rhizomicrobium sp.]|nr:hypothetical protein [Rhizomicrobium sp.]